MSTSTLAAYLLSVVSRSLRRFGRNSFGCSLLLLTACTSSTSSEESQKETAVEETLPAATPATRVAPGRLAYFYSGTLAGKLRVHFYLLPEGNARLYGQYRYEGRTGAIGLTGQRKVNGQLVLREYTNEAQPQHPTAEFRLVLQADGSLVGTWHTLSATRPRQLAVVLQPEAAPASGCQGPVITNLTSDVPIITVADTAATQKLREQMNSMMASDDGDPGTLSWLVDYADNCLLGLKVTSEVEGASVTQGNQRYVVDLRTGSSLTLASELLPARQAAFQAEANRRLQRLIEGFIREWGTNNEPFPAEDATSLRAQRLDLRSASNPSAYLAGDSVYFPIEVEYPDMSNFLSKTYHDAFAPAFSFDEIQPYLVPGSPLRRLASPRKAR
jgi:hypothetical protein